jgi:hypothetical protein
MIKHKKHNDFDILRTLYNANKIVKITTTILGGVLLVYLVGKTFNGIATVIRGFNNMKSAYNGK